MSIHLSIHLPIYLYIYISIYFVVPEAGVGVLGVAEAGGPPPHRDAGLQVTLVVRVVHLTQHKLGRLRHLRQAQFCCCFPTTKRL